MGSPSSSRWASKSSLRPASSRFRSPFSSKFRSLTLCSLRRRPFARLRHPTRRTSAFGSSSGRRRMQCSSPCPRSRSVYAARRPRSRRHCETARCGGSSWRRQGRRSGTGPTSSRSWSTPTTSAERQAWPSASLVRNVPAAFAAPLTGLVGDRYPRLPRHDRSRPDPRRRDVPRRRDDRARRAGRARLRAGIGDDRDVHRVPARPGRAAAVARAHAGRAHRVERSDEHDRRRRLLPRSGAGRPPSPRRVPRSSSQRTA